MTTEEKILENATALFRSKGCKSVTMEEIAIESGVSKKTLYRFFRDKSALLEASILKMDRKIKEEYNMIREGSDNVLESLLESYKLQSRAMANMNINFLDEVKKFYPEIYIKAIKCSQENLKENTQKMLEEGREQGVFIDNLNDLELKAIIFSLFTKRGLLNSPDIQNNYDRNTLFNNTVLVYLRGLSSAKGREIIDKYLESNHKNL